MNYYPLPYENLAGRIGDYWLEDGQVNYKEYGLIDVSPPESLYTSYEYTITVRRLMLRQKRRSLAYLR
jgi:hypothetical protein